MRRRSEDDRIGSEISDLPLGEEMAYGSAAASGVADIAHALLRSTAAAGDRLVKPGRLLRIGLGVLQLAGQRPFAYSIHGKSVYRGRRRRGCNRVPQAAGRAHLQARG